MLAFEWHKLTNPKEAEKEENTLPKLWSSFTRDIGKHTWLGDFDSTIMARLFFLSKAEEKPTTEGLEELKGASKEKLIKEAKTHMSHLHDSRVCSGQEKQVHIYHFAALRTIDVDILEHRHKRTNGTTAVKTTVRVPSNPLLARKKTKLIKNMQGPIALVPISWLADEKVRKG